MDGQQTVWLIILMFIIIIFSSKMAWLTLGFAYILSDCLLAFLVPSDFFLVILLHSQMSAN